MKLILQNGYPYPYPTNITEEEQDELAEAAAGHRLELDGVCLLQWLHTMTIEFNTFENYENAKKLTGWKPWSDGVLEAPTSSADGYGHPAIVAAGMAYCGFIFID